MEVVKPPTDSLYKFLCICGLLLVVYCNYSRNAYYKDQIPTDIRHHYQLAYDSILTDAHKYDIGADLATLRVRKEDSLKKFAEDKAGIIAGTIKTGQELKVIQSLNKYEAVGQSAFIVGLILWFIRIQRHQDIILAADSKAKQIEKAKSRFPPLVIAFGLSFLALIITYGLYRFNPYLRALF